MKIIIIGNSGSGKTWLANKLHDQFGFPVTHLDNLFWEPGGFNRKRSPEMIQEMIEKSLESDSWIVEGVFGELAESCIPTATTLIWLDIPWEVCESRLKIRSSESKQHLDREQSAEGLHNLLMWGSEYDQRTDLRSFQGHNVLFDRFEKLKFRVQTDDDLHSVLM